VRLVRDSDDEIIVLEKENAHLNVNAPQLERRSRSTETPKVSLRQLATATEVHVLVAPVAL
jgi:hypothetical protein